MLKLPALAYVALFILALVPWPAIQADVTGENAGASALSVDYTDRLIVKLRDQNPALQAVALNTERLRTLSTSAGVALLPLRSMSWSAQVMQLPERMSPQQAGIIAQKLAAHPDVVYAEPDRRVQLMAIPNDGRFPNQWHYMAPNIEPGGVNLPAAWDSTTGDAAIVVAVIDTGILRHVELDGRTVPGYDFISDAATANDGDGRDNDPSDPGDWVTNAESNATSGPFEGCDVTDSSWHGTHISGTIGAATNNGQGVAGINWVSRVLPVHTLGKCGGFLSDVIDGARWAAGLAVPGVPVNNNPAQVLNLSLGATGSCSRALQSAIDDVVGVGSVMVVPSGNGGTDVTDNSPANCNGVITAGATTRSGDRASYSNFGSLVDVSAPGGQLRFINDPDGILSTLNTGDTAPVADDYRYIQGTSFASSQVSGIVSLMLSANPALTPAEVSSGVQGSARAFPAESDCTRARCGAGIINAATAIKLAQIGQTVIVTATGPEAVEENSDPGVFTLSRTGDTSSALTVAYTLGGSAVNGDDYALLPGSIVLAAGAATADITVTPVNDDRVEADESVILTLTPATTYLIDTPGSARITIKDNGISGGGGGGCTINANAVPDPSLPALLMLSLLYLLRRRLSPHARRCLRHAMDCLLSMRR